LKTLIFSEEKLVERCLADDRKAQATLYEQHYADLYRLGMRYLSDHQDTEDVVIQSFTKAFKNLKAFQFQGQGSLGKWIRTILIHEALKLLQKRKAFAFNAPIEEVQVESTDLNALQAMAAQEIVRLIERLPSGYRTVFNLYSIEGYGHKEIGEMLGISESTSKTQLMKARKTLMQNIVTTSHYGSQSI